MQLVLLASLIFLSLVPDACASPAPLQVAEKEKRNGCNQDNLLNNLENSAHLSDSYRYCSALLSLPATSTLTKYTASCILETYKSVDSTYHPLYLYDLQHVHSSVKPISYNQAYPTPSTIPGGPLSYGWPHYYKRDQPRTHLPPTPTTGPALPQEFVRRGVASPPSWLPTTYPASRLSSACSCLSVPAAATTTLSTRFFSTQTTTTCTNFVYTTLASYPAFCAPSLQVNAPQPVAHPDYHVTPEFPAASKMDCCAACASVFNCVWWKFNFGTAGNGWQPGTCHYAYFTGTSSVSDVAICPNGDTKAIANLPTQNIGREANNNEPGYNLGPCGGGYDVFESADDEGFPDDYNARVCKPPTYNPPGCSS